MYNRKNLFESRLASGISSSAVAFSVTAGEGQYAPESSFIVGIYPADYASPAAAMKAGKHEWAIVGTRSTDACSSVVRGAFGSTALDHNESGKQYVVYNPVIANEMIGVNQLFKDAGGDDGYVISTGFSLTDLNRHDGNIFPLRVTTGNTGACGATVDTVTSKSIKVVDASGVRDPLTGELPAGGIALLQWSEDDDYFVLLNPANRLKKYVAILSQTETSAPIATILENTLGGTPVWTRESLGVYKATLTNKFPVGYTIVMPANAHDGIDDKPYLTTWNKSLSDANSITIQNYVSSTRALSDMNEAGDTGECVIEIVVFS
jgi:hypothetical protein